MAIYELVMKYDLYGQDCNNRFHYTSPSAGDLPGGAADLGGGFDAGTLVAALVDFWTDVNSVDFHTISVRSLYDVTDFFDTALVGKSGLGTQGEAVASSSALGFRSDRFRTGRNRGYKRFSGYGENAVSGNTYTDLVPAAAVANALNDLITGTTLGTLFGPRVLLLDEVTPGVYKIFPNEAEQRLNMSPFGISWTVNEFVTTQRSRLPGHGI